MFITCDTDTLFSKVTSYILSSYYSLFQASASCIRSLFSLIYFINLSVNYKTHINYTV